ncbi:hypothetical protein J3L18_09730 [Mucilaginibacter gossypii]|uniref:hypothetical protein n=1 Tax=Mucilaginibacter gossypii TaxID=551996 RepID=UPI000DCD1FA5|nr:MULTISPECIES: hypothetical protein [Mucilaginibacter]QTE39312.1 hypothetical protein J3L18_09730 [Mucilaginibacter gossypii]RAV60388.1 hypothetical protein DIU36_00745 [Mucilaginibacter rubeus]
MKNIGRYKTSIILQLMILAAGSLFSSSATAQKFLHKGDVVTISPGILHWHGTTFQNSFTQIAINFNIEKGIAIWLHISDNEYNSVK